MAKQRPSVQKRQRDMQKQERERKKAAKAAIKREKRQSGDKPDVVVLQHRPDGELGEEDRPAPKSE